MIIIVDNLKCNLNEPLHVPTQSFSLALLYRLQGVHGLSDRFHSGKLSDKLVGQVLKRRDGYDGKAVEPHPGVALQVHGEQPAQQCI